MAVQDGNNNNWISARYWWLIFLLIAINNAKADERQQAAPYFVEGQDMADNRNNFQQESNVSSKILDENPSCSSTFYERNFFFSSANYPQNYEDNSDCTFIVKRSDNVCNLQLVFQDFDLEGTGGCMHDYLAINGQKLCGSLSPNTQRIYPFIGPEILIRFRTNAVTSNRGFFIRGSQLTCNQASVGNYGEPSTVHNCDQTFDQRQFNVTSPNYPAAYASNLDCTYVIKKSDSDTCFLQIKFVSLELQESVGECLNDFLDVDHQRLCYLPKGSTKTVGFMGSVYCIRFRSGNSGRSACVGFSLSIQQLPCTSVRPPALPVPPFQPLPPDHGQFCSLGFNHSGHGPSTRTNDLLFHVRSPGFPLPYPPNQDCLLTVHKAVAGICTLQMIVEDFDVDPSPGCRHDFLSVGDQRLCGMLHKGSKGEFDFPGEELHVRFLSNGSRSRSGFFLTFWQKSCFFPVAKTTPIPWLPASHLDHNCDVVYTSRNFEIRFPPPIRFGSFNRMCTYTVRRLKNPNSCALVLEFLEFDFGTMDGSKEDSCEEAFLEINGERLCQNALRGTTRKYSIDRNVFQIRFSSRAVQQPRFRIRGEQLPCPVTPKDPYPYPVNPNYPYPSPHTLPPSPCNCTYQEEEFVIGSSSNPQFPFWPLESSFCMFLICKARLDICSVDVVFEHFSLQNTPGCSGEYLEVDGHRYCSTIPMGAVRRHEFRGNYLHINIYTCRGVFLLRFRQIPCTEYYPITPPSPPLIECDVIQSEPEFRWMSPNYPNPYGSNRDCRLTIQRYDPLVCEIMVTFNHFDLEQSADCQQDYLEILGQQFCGHMVEGTQRTLPFDASSLIVGFHSGQNYNNKGGFDAKFKQQLCLDGHIFRRSGIGISQESNLTIGQKGHSQSPTRMMHPQKH